ncbi:hypothetical protein GCM10009801_33910 [Streptomyces albiaxialis]|uniref:Uncharacterized protein n=1 Tax=Streptomyces albiaxialis TaxID=329523 RepID=A0ABN2VYJ2_9ACTN
MVITKKPSSAASSAGSRGAGAATGGAEAGPDAAAVDDVTGGRGDGLVGMPRTLSRFRPRWQTALFGGARCRGATGPLTAARALRRLATMDG